MQTKQIECFISAADCNSFSQAAREMYMTPPGLAKQIAALEAEIGFSLFTRTHKGVELTQGGKAFLADARKIAEDARNAIRRGREAAGAEQAGFAVGVISADQPLTGICAAFCEEEHVHLQYQKISASEKEDALASGKIDVFLNVGRPCDPDARFRYDVLYYSDLLCVLHISHRLAKQECISLRELDGETLIVPRRGRIAYYDEFTEYLQNTFPKIRLRQCESAIATYMSVQLEGCISFFHRLQELSSPDLCVCRLDVGAWRKPVEICAVQRNEKNALCDRFIRSARRSVYRMMDEETKKLQEEYGKNEG